MLRSKEQLFVAAALATIIDAGFTVFGKIGGSPVMAAFVPWLTWTLMVLSIISAFAVWYFRSKSNALERLRTEFGILQEQFEKSKARDYASVAQEKHDRAFRDPSGISPEEAAFRQEIRTAYSNLPWTSKVGLCYVARYPNNSGHALMNWLSERGLGKLNDQPIINIVGGLYQSSLCTLHPGDLLEVTPQKLILVSALLRDDNSIPAAFLAAEEQ